MFVELMITMYDFFFFNQPETELITSVVDIIMTRNIIYTAQ